MLYSVYLSPSTQERNIGVLDYGTEEKRMNRVSDIVRQILERHNIVVFSNKPEWDLEHVVEDSNSKKPDLHFAIHSNAGGGSGCEIYAFSQGSEGDKAANIIYKEIEPLTPSKDRGIKYSKELYELRTTNAPAVLIEVGFHDNETDAIWIMNNTEIIGTALAIGVLKFFGIAYDNKNIDKNKNQGKSGIVTGRVVNIRSGPSVKSKIIGKAKKGEKVKLIKKTRVWWYVDINGEKGYIYEKYVAYSAK